MIEISARQQESPLVRVENLCKRYTQRRALSAAEHTVEALVDAHLTIPRGKTLALIGDSGSGKSTLARCLVLFEKPEAGDIWFDGLHLLELTAKERFAIRNQIQMIFQEPASALNPRMRALDIVAEPLVIQKRWTRARRYELAQEWIERVGLPPDSVGNRPLEFSGGQRQRLAIARALIVEPRFLILDEALSRLDLANQELMLQLLADLQAAHSLTYLHISHDLPFVSRFADEIAVMHAGRVVEQQSATQLLSEPKQAYTRDLLLAMPSLESICMERLA